MIWRGSRPIRKVTIGSATVNYPVLANLKDADAAARDDDGQGGGGSSVPPQHQAFRLSVRGSRSRGGASMSVMAEEAGFASAVSTIPGVVEAAGTHQSPRAAPHRLGRPASVRCAMMRVMLSGIAFAPVRPTRSAQI